MWNLTALYVQNVHNTGIILCMRPANGTTPHCNVVSHWLDAYTKWSLIKLPVVLDSLLGVNPPQSLLQKRLECLPRCPRGTPPHCRVWWNSERWRTPVLSPRWRRSWSWRSSRGQWGRKLWGGHHGCRWTGMSLWAPWWYLRGGHNYD